MKVNFVALSLETHLFFGRIMKEHAFFLMAGFPGKNEDYIEKADWFRVQFEELLAETVELSRGRVGEEVLCSGEIVTEYTLGAERKTDFLTGIHINSSITEDEIALKEKSEHGNNRNISFQDEAQIRRLNRKALNLLEGLIEFKENILHHVGECQLFTFNYPLLIEHILREAKLYRSMVMELERTGTLNRQNRINMEVFWNQIMMEHAFFIRGLLDPCEEELICTANDFAMDYKKLLEEAKRKDCMVTDDLHKRAINETRRYRDFKAEGTKGIIDCEIAGLILPLLADHVLREANHYLRILEN